MKLSKSKTGFLSKLSMKKARDEEGLFLVEGTKSVLDMKDFFEVKYIVATSEWLSEHPFDLADDKKLEASREQLSKISSFKTIPEVIAVFKIPGNAKLQKLDPDSLNLLLDGVQDPGNLGTIIRTADWFGVTRIFISEDCADAFNPKTVQSSMGSLSRVQVVRTDLCQLLENCELPIIGTLLEGESLYSSKISDKCVIIMGNEGNGISEKVREMINLPVSIPPFNPSNHPDSLNVGIACGIVLSYIRMKN